MIGAKGLLGGAYLNRKWLAFAVPILAVWITDLFLNIVIYSQYYDGFVLFSWRSAAVFAGVAAIVLLGILLLRKITFTSLIKASIAASLLFFLITNFGSWLVDPMYPNTVGGLMSAYVAGLPFLLNTLLANILFSFAFFGVVEYVVYKRSIFAFSY